MKQLRVKWLVLIIILIPINQLTGNYFFTQGAFNSLTTLTAGLINPTLQANLPSLLLFGFIIFCLGKLPASTVWISPGKFNSGLKWGLLIWLIAQLFVLVITLATGKPITFMVEPLKQTGYFLGQLLGNAPLEELLYRGVLLLQIYLLVRQRSTHSKSLLIALIISQLIFSLIHIPNRLLIEQSTNLLPDLAALFFAGIVLALIYLRTTNFIFVVLVHTFINTPFNLIETDLPIARIIGALALIVTFTWPIIVADEGTGNFLRFGIQSNYER